MYVYMEGLIQVLCICFCAEDVATLTVHVYTNRWKLIGAGGVPGECRSVPTSAVGVSINVRGVFEEYWGSAGGLPE